MTSNTALPAEAPALGSIYDLGYRRYEGPRLGRRHAFAALFRDSLRATFGIGRGGRAKVAPFAIAVLALLPALVAVGVAGLVNQIPGGAQSQALSPVRYETYYALIAQLLFTFAAAQAPELLGRDLRHHVLSLLFSRALRRDDYVAAKLGALVSALLLVQLLPQLIIFAGRALASTDVTGSIAADAGKLPPVLAQAGIVAVTLGSISLAIASYSARRSYATAGIIVAFVVPPLAAGLLRNLAEAPDSARVLSLLSPPDLLDATNRWLFDLPASSRVLAGGPVPAVVALVASATAIAVLARRYRRMPA
jgi:ABC-2 type transport system permease protein